MLTTVEHWSNIITQLDHCNSVLVATFVYLQDRLQSVLNAAARLVYSRRTSEHTTPLLRELYWLRVPERIQFRLCILAYHCVHGTPRAYLSDSLRPTSEIVARRCLRSADTTVSPAGAVDSSGYPWRPCLLVSAARGGHGTVCHQRLGPAPHF